MRGYILRKGEEERPWLFLLKNGTEGRGNGGEGKWGKKEWWWWGGGGGF